MKRSSPLRRRKKGGPPRHGLGCVNRDLEKQFQYDWGHAVLFTGRGRKRGCVVCNRPADDAHHVVYKRDLRDRGLFCWDIRDGLPLCRDCHDGHHYSPQAVVTLEHLTDANLDYAFEVLGAYAYDYLRRRYPGPDGPHNLRLEARLAAAQEAGLEAEPDEQTAA